MEQNVYTNGGKLSLRKTIILLLLLLFPALGTNAQQMLRAYEDNDVLNITGDATDDAYTNGTRFDYFYVKDHKSKFFLDRWMPKAGDSAVNTFGWSLMQMMFTPQHITKVKPDIHDYPYAGSLFVTHSLHSSNPVKKYNLQMEVLAGVIGKTSFAEQTQIFVHRLINNDRPMGWQYQSPTAPLLNLNFAAEKMIWHYKGAFEIVGGGQGLVGTFMDGVQAYSVIRLGKMNPYFNGNISQYSGTTGQKFQLYMYGKPSVEWIGYNSMVDGGIFRGRSDYYHATDGADETPASTNRGIAVNMEVGAVLAWKNIGFSFSQKFMPPMLNSFSHHTVGNISLYVSW